ncbi:uvrD/REP helicase [Gallibacterium genomosp. 3]|uniref:UvrD/REP helicase n=1 Tax=Gallibacterium genomosp. 3 TaxID=505345 RepID=A0A1A7PJT6_9PAST|nr:DNA helicase UvrD [Gallibacterium genomosp. 3]OBX02793.1 uvrD/REP helicase [Gallibacterium genomosp. 3]
MQIKQILIALDQLANTLVGGYADETISSRCYRNAKLKDSPKKRWVFFYALINTLFCDKNHCKEAYQSEVLRRQYPSDFRE